MRPSDTIPRTTDSCQGEGRPAAGFGTAPGPHRRPAGGQEDRRHGRGAPYPDRLHLYCGPIEGAANIQLPACSSNFLILESIQTWGGFHAEILKQPIRWEDGYVIPSSEPGLGVELDEAVAAAHPYEGAELHLEMDEEPVRDWKQG